jgi:hypothetical protein
MGSETRLFNSIQLFSEVTVSTRMPFRESKAARRIRHMRALYFRSYAMALPLGLI